MRRLLAATAVIALAAGGAALAQSTDTEDSTDATFGSQVRVLAQGQKNSDTKGIGAEVSALAHARNDARAAARHDTGDVDDNDETDAGDVDDNDDTDASDVDNDETSTTDTDTTSTQEVATTATFGSQVKALAKAQKGSDVHGIGAQVSAMAHDRNDARASARGSATTETDLRTSRTDVQLSANIATDARATGQAARDAAMTVRDAAKDARNNSASVRDAARSIRDAVQAARPGHH